MGTAWKNTADTFIKPTFSSSKIGYSVKPASAAASAFVSSALVSSAFVSSVFEEALEEEAFDDELEALLPQPERAAVAVTAIAAAQMIARIFFICTLLLL